MPSAVRPLLVAALASGLALGIGAAANAEASVRTSLTLSPTSRTAQSGSVVTFTAHLTNSLKPLARQKVSLWYRPADSAAWRRIATALTDARGDATMHRVVTGTRQWQARYSSDGFIDSAETQVLTVEVPRPTPRPQPPQRTQAQETSRSRLRPQPQARPAPQRPSPAQLSFGQRVIAEAARHKGAPYLWGATGPYEFDCSGFTMYVFARFGIHLPRTAEAQFEQVPRIPNADVSIGDLVFIHDGPNGYVGHVGIYAGPGIMWAATHTGDVVRIESIAPNWTAGRVR